MLKVAQIWGRIQGRLFGHIERSLDMRLTAREKQLVAILEIVRIEEHVPSCPVRAERRGRPRKDRRAIARAFIAKAVYDLPQTKTLLEMLLTQPVLREICGFREVSEVPSEAVLSRSFAAFAADGLGDKVHAALVKEHLSGLLIGHVSRDSTAIEAREKPAPKSPKPPKEKRKPGPPKKGEVREPAEQRSTRLPTQLTQDPQEALKELPKDCDVGTKRDSKGHPSYWVGYKAHMDVSDAGLPVTVVTTSASLHDSQAAIPMEKVTAQRVTSLYAVMDKAYEAALIEQCCREQGHVPIIEHSQRGAAKQSAEAAAPHRKRFTEPLLKAKEPWDAATTQRFKERTSVERAYSRLKDQFGGRHVRVRGHAKVHLHIMFGVLALFADQLLQLVT